MKKLIIITSVFFVWCLFSQAFSNFDFNVYAQGFDLERNKNNNKTAILLISKFEMSLKTEGEMLFSSALPTFIKTSLYGNKYKWLEIATDSASFVGANRFVLNGTILDYVTYLKIKLKITSSDNNELIATQTYKMEPDSILICADRMSKDIASIISKKISTIEQEEVISLLIFPFESDIQDSILNTYGDYLASSFLYEFKKSPIISKVGIKTSEVSIDQISEEFNLIFKGTFHPYKDYSLDVSASLSEAETGKKIYVVRYHIDADDFLDGPKTISDRFKDFLLVYPYIRDDLLSFQDAKDFYKQGKKYLEDLNDQNAKIEAEVMYYKAIEIDTLYIPAIKGLGDLAKEDYRYDQAISFYKQILKIDSLNIEAYINLGDAYYYNYQDTLAFVYYLKAAYLSRTNNQDSYVCEAYKRLGALYSAYGDYPEAINYYELAFKIDKNDPLVWYGLGNSHFIRYYYSDHKVQDTTDIYLGVNFFCDGIKYFPEDSTFKRNTSYLLNYWGKVYYDEYIKLFDNYDTTATSFANLAYKKFDEASQITNYDNNLMAENFNYLAWFNYYTLFDFDRGKEYSRKAKELNPSDEWTYRLFAATHKNDTTYIKDALQSIKKAISIEKNAYSSRTLGDIYLNMKLYDSAYVAYQNAREIENITSSSTIKGLYNSAIMSKKPELIKSSELEINNYLQKDIPKYDSLWAFISLAEIKREQTNFDSALAYVNLAYGLNSDSKDIDKVLDSLCYVDSFKPAIELRIAQLENDLKESKKIGIMLNLINAYMLIQDYEKSIDYGELAFSISRTRNDTVDINCNLGRTYYQMGLDFYNKKDYSNGYKNMLKAEEYFKDALYPNWSIPLAYLQIINHEYIINFEKSYEWSLQLIKLDSLSSSYFSNYIEAAFTSRRFKEAYNQAEKIIISDSLKKQPLDFTNKLAIRYILVAAKLFDKDPDAGSVEFREFKRIYIDSKDKVKKGDWSWSGTKKFIQEYNDIDTFYRNILLDILKLFEVEREDGLNILNEVETKWKR